eukprot:Gb_11966 [translate_table: standard]
MMLTGMAMATQRRIARYIAAATVVHSHSNSTLFKISNNNYHRHMFPVTPLPAFSSFSAVAYPTMTQSDIEPKYNLMDKQHHQMEELEWAAIYDVLYQLGSSPSLERTLDDLDLTLTYALVKRVLQTFARSEKVAFRFFLWAAKQSACEPTADAYHMIVQIFRDAHRLNNLLALIMEIRRDGCFITPEGFAVVMNIYGYAGMTGHALETFDRMSILCCKPSAPAYNALVTVLCKALKIQLAKGVFLRMCNFRCVPNSTTYSVLIDASLKCGELKEALWFMKKAIKRRTFPSPETIVFFVNSMCKGLAAVERASKLLNTLADSGCPLNTSAFNTLIRKYCQFHKAKEALQIYEKMEKLGLYPDNMTYAPLIRLFADNLEKVTELVQNMTSKGLTHDAHTLHGFIDALCRRRRLEEACKVLDEMLKNNHKPGVDTYTVLIMSLCTVDRAEDAFTLFRDMEKRGGVANIEMCSILIHTLCKQDKIDRALELFNQLDEMNIVPKIDTYRIVEKSLMKARRKQEAEELLNQMLAKGYNQKQRLHVSR